ncbi:MAG: DUF4136 domain-containing protein [Adhaeribacter sp.]
MKKQWHLILICLGLLGCTTVQVKNTEAGPGFALHHYQTFGFYEPDTQNIPAEQAYQDQVMLLQNAIRDALRAKGLAYEPAGPDLLVNIGVVTQEKVQTRQTDFRTDAPRYIGQRRYSWHSEEVEVGRYQEGTVSVHLVDRQKNDLVWKGTATAVIPRQQARRQKTISTGINKLFESL